MWINPNKNIEHLKIDLGAGNPEDGEVQANGFVLQDVMPFKGIDLVCKIQDLREFIKPEQCSHIRASHVIEHFGIKEYPEILKMIYELLESGGTFEMIVPNFKWHASLLMQGRDDDAVMYAYGGQLDEWDYHKMGFTSKIIYDKFTELGFKIEDLLDESSITVIAKK